MHQSHNKQAWSLQITLFIIASLLILVDCEAQARDARFPLGCQVSGFSFESNKLVLNNDNPKPIQTLYFIHNQSSDSIHIEYQKDPKAFMSPSWVADVDANQWAAFATDKSGVTFACQNQQKSEANCQEVFEICQFPNAKFATSNLGNYWVATNKSQDATVNAAVKKGILLR